MAKQDKIAIKNAQRRRENLLKVVSDMKTTQGWIKYTRVIMGLTLKELGKLSGLTVSGVSDAERREREGKITVENLAKMANAMDCEFVYAFIPKEDIPVLLKKKALIKARKAILKADTHMTLEDQKVTEELDRRIEDLAEKLLERGKVW